MWSFRMVRKWTNNESESKVLQRKHKQAKNKNSHQHKERKTYLIPPAFIEREP